MEKATKYIGQTREFSFFQMGRDAMVTLYLSYALKLAAGKPGRHESPFQKESEFVLKTREAKNTKKGKTSKIPSSAAGTP